MMAEKLPNPFETSKGPDTDDYIGFSASSTPREDRFIPKRGKKNRQDNWRRFGAFDQQQQQQNFYSPRGGMGGSPHTSKYILIIVIQCLKLDNLAIFWPTGHPYVQLYILDFS